MKLTTIIACCLILLAGFELNAQTVERGPYLQTGTPTAITVKWRTSYSTSTKIWYGTSLSNLNQSQVSSSTVTDHEITIQGLAPNTKYYYTIGKNNQQLIPPSSGMYFKTSPSHGTDQPIRAWIIGDAGVAGTGGSSATQDQQDVRDAYYTETSSAHTDLMLMLGDNAYTDGKDHEYQPAMFENMYEDLLRKTVVWSCPGNHDLHESSPAYFDIFSFPKNGEAGGLASGSEEYYSFDYGNVHFISMASQNENKNPGSPMLVWLENDLSNTTADWIVAFWHHPPYSKGSHDTDQSNEYHSFKMRENVLPILEANGVDLVLSGHSHSYERSHLLKGHYGTSGEILSNPSLILDSGGGRENGAGAYQKDIDCTDGAVYSVIGSSGKVNSVTQHNAMYTYEESLGSGILEINGNRLDMTFIDENGNALDNFTLLKDDYGEDCEVNPPGEVTVCRKITDQKDDAEEHQGGYVSMYSSDLEMVDDNGGIQEVGLRFTNLGIPAEAEILDAYVQFTSKQSSNGSASLVISGEDDPNPPNFDGGNNNISTRQETGNSVNWNPASWGSQGQSGAAQKTPDLKNIVQEIVDQNGFSASSPIVLMIKGTQGTRNAMSYEGNSGQSAELCIRYTDGVTPPTANILDIPVSSGNDDAEQNIYGGYVSLNSTDLEMSKDLSGGQTQLVGIRFTNIGLKANDNVTKAYIQFTAKESNSDPSNLTIKAQKSTNPAAFQSSSNDIGARITTSTSTNWSPSSWSTGAAGTAQQTSDLTAIIQELQGQSGFSENSPMAFIISGTGTRNAHSFNGNPNSAAVLHIEIEGGTPPTTGTTTVQVSDSDDDVEESPSGYMSFGSSDLELSEDGSNSQKIGLLFRSLGLPSNADITNAYIQFTVDETGSTTTNLSIKGWKTANPQAFNTASGTISALPKTSNSTQWSPAAWNSIDEAGSAQRTPNLSTVVQEIVDQSGFGTSSNMAFIIEGTGTRTAISHDKSSSKAAKLVVEYSTQGSTRQAVISQIETGIHFEVYPNPAKDLLTVEFEQEGISSAGFLQLFDMTGRLVHQEEFSTALLSTNVDVKMLPKGMYAARVIVGDYQVSKTFVKK